MMFLFEVFEEHWIDPITAKSILSIMAITSLISRIIIGVIVDRPWMDSVILQVVGFLASAGIAFAITYCSTYYQFLVACIFLACTHYCMYPTVTILLVDVFGLKLLTKTFGILNSVFVIGVFLGAPITGHLNDLFKSFSYVPYLIAGLHGAGAICMIAMKFVIMKK